MSEFLTFFRYIGDSNIACARSHDEHEESKKAIESKASASTSTDTSDLHDKVLKGTDLAAVHARPEWAGSSCAQKAQFSEFANASARFFDPSRMDEIYPGLAARDGASMGLTEGSEERGNAESERIGEEGYIATSRVRHAHSF